MDDEKPTAPPRPQPATEPPPPAAEAEFDGKVALVTGAARGLGACCALALAKRGADVALLDSPGELETPPYALSGESELEEIATAVRERGAAALPLAADVRDHAAVRGAVAATTASLGEVDLLVLAAGIRTAVPAAEMSDAQWKETIDVNLHGAHHAMRAVVPRMIVNGGGRIVLFAGNEGRRATPHRPRRAAATWPGIDLARSVAVETAGAGIAVNVVCTTPLDTAMFQTAVTWAQVTGGASAVTEEVEHAPRARHPLSGAYAPLDRVVETALFLLGQPGAELTGSVVDVSTGLSALNSA